MIVDIPKTLIIDLSKGYGGSTTRVLNLMKNMPKDKIGLVCLHNSELAKHAQEQNIPFYSVGKSKYDPQILWQLIKIIRENQFDVLDIQNIQSKFWANFAAIMTGSSLISTLHSWYKAEHGANLRGQIYQWLEFKSNQKLHSYICVSDMDRKRLLDAGIPAKSIQLIYNVVEIEPAKIRANREQILAEFDLPEDAILCTAVGRLVWPKGYKDLVSAFQKIADKHPKLHCIIIGDGPLREPLLQQIQAAKLENRFKLTGYMTRDRVLPIVKSSNIFAMPSYSEGTPIALLEAASLSRPIIATNAGGIPELVKHNQEAILVPIGDVDALANGLSKLCTNEQFATEIGQHAALRTKTKFSLNSLIQSTAQAYRSTIQ